MAATPDTASGAGLSVPDHPILIHSHIFKNAGSSLDRLLATCFGTGWISFDPTLPAPLLDAGCLSAFLATRPGVRAVSSHLPLGLLPVPRSAPMIMLRHPIDRARSVFQFLRRDTSQEDHAVTRGGFADYVRWALDTPGKGVAVRNYQVFHLSSARLSRDNPQLATTRQDLTHAEALLAALPAFGLVRRFADSCRLFEATYAPLLPQLRLYDAHENASADGKSLEADAIAAAHEELGDTVFGRLCAANDLDLALYRLACRLFEEHMTRASIASCD